MKLKGAKRFLAAFLYSIPVLLLIAILTPIFYTDPMVHLIVKKVCYFYLGVMVFILEGIITFFILICTFLSLKHLFGLNYKKND